VSNPVKRTNTWHEKPIKSAIPRGTDAIVLSEAGKPPKRYEKPSQIIKKELNALQEKAIVAVSEKLNVSKEDARVLLESTDGSWEKLKEVVKREVELRMITDIIPQLEGAISDKTAMGSMEQAQKAVTAWAIARDKVFGEMNRPGLVVGGKNVQINLGWKFKPYGKK